MGDAANGRIAAPTRASMYWICRPAPNDSQSFTSNATLGVTSSENTFDVVEYVWPAHGKSGAETSP
jgi:hypothetical protein